MSKNEATQDPNPLPSDPDDRYAAYWQQLANQQMSASHPQGLVWQPMTDPWTKPVRDWDLHDIERAIDLQKQRPHRWLRRWFGLRCLLRSCPFVPDERGAHCAFGCGRRITAYHPIDPVQPVSPQSSPWPGASARSGSV